MHYFSPEAAPRPVRSVIGDISYEKLGVADAHNHVWIDPIPGADDSAPVLNQFDLISSELEEYRSAGGTSLLDCQPGGCGRNGNQLLKLSESSKVILIACTGFHRQKYYPSDHWLFKATDTQIAKYITEELTQTLEECRDAKSPVRAGFIKIALETEWRDSPQAALEATAAAACETRSLVEVHTEKGALAEKAVIFFEDHGVLPYQLVLCHMDKRPDIGLHSELCKVGVLVEYDTFYRSKYDPETHLWPLIQHMHAAGLGSNVALATDMAETVLYKSIGGGPGLASLPTEIHTRLINLGIPTKTVQKMTGGNIARRLAGLL